MMDILFNRNTFLFAFIFFFPFLLFGQDPVQIKRSENKVVIQEKVYYVHVVKQGHTLYSIAKAYNVSEKEIIIENPGVTEDLFIGQVLKVPSRPESSFDVYTAEDTDEENVHIIQEGETLYSISRAYNSSEEEILQLNPDIDINDIPLGKRIILPGKDEARNELSFDEEGFILHKVKKGETLTSISRYYGVSIREIKNVNPNLRWGKPRNGDVISIPQSNLAIEPFVPDTFIIEPSLIEHDTIEQTYSYDELLDEPEGPGVLKIAYLIPFDYEQMEPLDSLLKDVKSAIRRNRITEDYKIEKATPKSLSFLEFFEGSLLAIDALSESGPKLDIRVYDTKRSMHHTKQILKNPEMKDADLIIGPFFAYNLELVSEFAFENKIPLVTPFHSDDSLVVNNPYLFQVTPSYKSEYKRNAEFIARSYDKNLIFVHDGDSSNLEEVSYYKKALFDELEKYSADESVVFKEVVLKENDMSDLIQALNSMKKNLVILPSNDEAFSSQIARTLYYQLDSCDVELFGSSYWPGFKNIEISYIHALKLQISSCYWFDYSDPDLLVFLANFRQNYYKEPEFYTRRGVSFGVSGYDISTYFLSALKKYGKRFIFHLNEYKPEGTLTDYNFSKASPTGGYKNVHMDYYLFDDELFVRSIDLPSRPPVHYYLQPATDDPIYFLRSNPVNDSLAPIYRSNIEQ